MNSNKRYHALRRVSVITVAINLVLSGAKFVTGIISGSTAVLSDGVHSLSDVFTTLVVMMGLRFSSTNADREHPYGHQRVESLISFFLAFLLALSALYLGWQGMQKLTGESGAAPSGIALLVTLASIAVKEWMYRYTKGAATRYQSTSMLSDAWHHRTDAISSIAVLVGVGGAYLGIGILDPIAAMAVCLIICKAAYDIGKAAVEQLIDRSADSQVVEGIRTLALSVQGVCGVDLLRTRVSNNVIFVEIEVAVNHRLSVAQGHQIAHDIHDAVENSDYPVWHCMVHINPCLCEEVAGA